MDVLLLQPVTTGFMRRIVTVQDVLALFPHRKKTWAYELLATIRAATGKMTVSPQQLAEYTGEELEDVQAALRAR